MKKVIVFGGGTGLSCLLSGLKLFPVEVTTVITVSDNGSSTGVLKQEFDIPAVGDVGKVLLSIGAKELQSLIDEGKPAELNCNFCGKSYTFSVEEMKEILAAARQQRLRNIHVADSVTDSGRK